jgi:hypothetical protein
VARSSDVSDCRKYTMKLTAATIKKMTGSVVRGEKHYGEHLMMSPIRDWYVGIAVFLTVGILGAVWAATTFVQYQVTDAYEMAKPVEIEVYKSATVDAALKELDERSLQYKVIEERLTSTEVGNTPDETAELILEDSEKETSSTTAEEIILELDGGVEPAL